jgi:hypothetical protein
MLAHRGGPSRAKSGTWLPRRKRTFRAFPAEACFRPFGDIHNGQRVAHIAPMAKPTALQRYYLFLIAYMRWFGVVFAALAVLITASNLPWLMRSNDWELLAANLGGGAAFLLVGLALYRIGTAVQRRYRAHIAGQLE